MAEERKGLLRSKRLRRIVEEFEKFALRGNVVDMAVGILLGAALGTIASSLVDDIIMPPVGAVIGGVDFTELFFVIKEGDPTSPYSTLVRARDAGAVTINYGLFINNIISFIVVALVLFLSIRGFNELVEAIQGGEEDPSPTTRKCPYCFSTIALKATRCPHCTSQLEPVPEPATAPGESPSSESQ